MTEDIKTTFPNGWSSILYAEAVDSISTNKKKISQKKYLESGSYPIFDQGNNHIGGYTDDPEKVIHCDFPVIVFGDHTRAVKIAKEPFAAGADGVKVLQPKKFISPILLKYFTNYLAISIKDKGYARHYQWVAKEAIGIPPANEQHRIVAKIEELFSELDKGIESLKTSREQLKVYRQALLKHAFEGRLTEQWRKDNADKLEAADKLLERIKQEREARYQQQLEDWKAAVKQWEADGKEGKKPAKPKALAPFRTLTQKELEKYDELPANWAWTRFENLIEYVTSGSRGWAKYYSSEGATFIRAQNLKYDHLDLSDIAYVSLPDSAEGKRTLTKQFDLLITITGANVTKSAYLKDDIGEAYVSQHVALSRLINVSLAKYLYLFLISSSAGRRQLKKAAYGAGKPGLNLDNIKDLVVPLSSVAECNFVAQLIEEKLSVVDDQIQGIDVSLSKSEALRQSILKKAFSGKLVPQDPDDEPASVLLDRITKEKEEAAAKAQKAKAAGKKRVTRKAS